MLRALARGCRPAAWTGVVCCRSLVLCRPLDSFLRLGEEVWHHVCDEFLLMLVHSADVVDCLDTLLPKCHKRRKEFGLCDGGFHKGALCNAFLPCQSSHDTVGKLSARVGHGE